MKLEELQNEVDIDLLAASCPIPISDYKEITLAHGSGGKLTHSLIEKMLLPQFKNDFLDSLHDGAVISHRGVQFAFSTDSYVVHPIFFPGGNIGDLAINGTVNDVSMCGAKPLYLSCGFIIEEGFSMEDFWRVVVSMQQAAAKAGVMLVTGDTKVVDRGKGDQIYINTSGIGIVPDGINIHPSRVRAGDKIIINGPIALHGIAIMSVREGLEFESEIKSDTVALNGLVETILNENKEVHIFRDPTRGGVGTTLKEIASSSGLGIFLEETMIPISEDVKGACEILGLDPLYVANEGKLIVIVPPETCNQTLLAMRSHSLGRESCVIGEVVNTHASMVIMRTAVGGSRVIDMLSGEQLPRIC